MEAMTLPGKAVPIIVEPLELPEPARTAPPERERPPPSPPSPPSPAPRPPVEEPASQR
jgi:hypothetical protein